MHFRTRGQKIFIVINYILVIIVCLSCFLPIVNTLAILIWKKTILNSRVT